MIGRGLFLIVWGVRIVGRLFADEVGNSIDGVYHLIGEHSSHPGMRNDAKLTLPVC